MILDVAKILPIRANCIEPWCKRGAHAITQKKRHDSIDFLKKAAVLALLGFWRLALVVFDVRFELLSFFLQNQLSCGVLLLSTDDFVSLLI